jgi:capsular polysaccharide biosynthesis protein
MKEGPFFPGLGGITTEEEGATAPGNHSSVTQSPVVLVGRLVSLRFVLGALRRRRKIWLSLAALGLVVGVGYHVAVPRSYSAHATLYLAQSPGSDPSVGIANDLALLQTNAVGQRAADLLGEPSLSPSKLLGKAPGTVESDDVLTLNVAGPTKAEAVRRANALAQALLGIRAELIQQQTASSDKALQDEISSLQQQINQLSATINDPGASQSSQLTTLVGKQSGDTSEVAALQQTIQQNQLASVAITSGSRVVTAGTLVPASTAKLFGLDGIAGLIGGLAIGVALVAVQAVVSDRLRRRDEVASLLGAPVELSLMPIRHLKFHHHRWVRRSALERQGEVDVFAGYLRRRGIRQGGRKTLLVVAVDDLAVPAAALAVLAKRLADEGESVLVADLTNEGLLARIVGDLRVEGESLPNRSGRSIHLFTPPPDDMNEIVEPPWVATTDVVSTVLILTAMDLARGAWHLTWATQAVVTVTAGRSSARRVSSTAALLRAAGITIRSGVLIGADAEDQSIGLLQPEFPLVGLPATDGAFPV